VRRRLLWVFIALGVGASLTWVFRTEIFLFLLAPAGDRLSVDGKAIFLSPTEMFSLTVGLTIKGGLLAATPVLAYNGYALFRPFLSRKKRRTVLLFLVMAFVLYSAGVAFTYFALLPASLRFLLSFGTDIATPMIRMTEYMDLAMAMFFWLGIVFELPLAMLLLAVLRVVSYKGFAKARPYVPATAFILSAIITPTFDIITQALVAVPLIALYEVGVFLAWLARPKEYSQE